MQRVPRASFFLTTQRRLCGGELQLTSKGGTMPRTLYQGEVETDNHTYQHKPVQCPRTTSPFGVGSFVTSHNSKSFPTFAFSEA